jgi:hypothetical protein
LPANATGATCNAGACQITSCGVYMVYTPPPHGCGAHGTAYYADCDQVFSNGCEAVANTNSSCGGCFFQCPGTDFCSNWNSVTRSEVSPCEDTSGNPTNPQCTGDFYCGHSNGC